PTVEVDLCGHATLASAHVLWEDEHLDQAETARFHTRSGLLTARKVDDWIEMDFPSLPPEEVESSERLAKALRVQPLWVGRSGKNLIVRIADEKMVRSMRPNMAEIATLDALGVIVTSEAISDSFDFVSRY